MTPVDRIQFKFVEFLPEQLDEATVYISMTYATAAHRCCCGCGNEVVTKFSPTDWKLLFDGKTISLDPSIGNWGFDCRSHYWIRQNQVNWAGTWTQEDIESGRRSDQIAKQRYYASDVSTEAAEIPMKDEAIKAVVSPTGFWKKLWANRPAWMRRHR